MTDTEVVTLDVTPPLAVIRMHDDAGHNRLTPDLVQHTTDALVRAGEHPDVRAVILSGSPDVFCAGGTASELLSTTDEGVTHRRHLHQVRDLLTAVTDCPVPVVAQAQGHAVGAGLVLILYCDLSVFSERSRYAANFMAYGFTPGLGSTYLIPAAMGRILGNEMLYTARSYRGSELAARGAGITVVDHNKVPDTARRLALRATQAPREPLRLLKARLNDPWTRALAQAAQGEVPDHQHTINTDEARQRIRRMHAQVHNTGWDRPDAPGAQQ